MVVVGLARPTGESNPAASDKIGGGIPIMGHIIQQSAALGMRRDERIAHPKLINMRYARANTPGSQLASSCGVSEPDRSAVGGGTGDHSSCDGDGASVSRVARGTK